MQKDLNHGPLLDEEGNLIESGFSYSLKREYDRTKIKGLKTRIKEWDYYFIRDDEYLYIEYSCGDMQEYFKKLGESYDKEISNPRPEVDSESNFFKRDDIHRTRIIPALDDLIENDINNEIFTLLEMFNSKKD